MVVNGKTDLSALLEHRRLTQHTVEPLNDEMLKQLVDAGEERPDLDYKASMELAEKRDTVELVKDIAAIANTRTGFIVLGVNDAFQPVGIDRQRLDVIRVEDLLNKASAYIYPNVDELRFKTFQKDERWFGAIHVSHIPGVIHIFWRDGDYPTADPKKPGHAFRKGMIYVRHGAKSEIITPHDMERLLKERDRVQKRFFLAGIRRISAAPVGSQVIIQPRGKLHLTQSPTASAVRLTTDPSAPGVRGLMDADKFHTTEEELLGALKLWKSSQDAYPSMMLLAKAYAQREKIKLGEESLAVIIYGSLHHQMPWAFWCGRFKRGRLEETLRTVAERDAYPSVREAVKALWLLGSRRAQHLLRGIAKKSHLPSARREASRMLEKWGIPDRVVILAMPFGKTVFHVGSETRTVNLRELVATPQEAAAMATSLADSLILSRQAEVKGFLKKLDLFLYGESLSRIRSRKKT